MFQVKNRTVRFQLATRAAVSIAALGLAAVGISADGGGSPGPQANTCGVQPAGADNAKAKGKGGQARNKTNVPIYPPGQYPVKLPMVSLLGARNDLPNPYRPGVSWGTLPPGRKWGSVASVSLAPDGTIWAADRCGENGSGGTACIGPNVGVNPIFQFDTSGKMLKQMGAGMFVNVHKMSIDKDGFLWVADNSGQQVFKLNQDGKILLTLGKKGVVGKGNDEFDGPTEAAIAPNGDIFVADGHNGGGTPNGNARVQKFDKNGKYLMTIGKKGMGQVEFDQVHTVAFDSRGRLFVGDRQNNRIQVLTQDGKWIATWYQFGRPSSIYIDKNDNMYVADSESRDGRTNSGEYAMRETGYGYNAGAQRGIRIGSAKDGTVKSFIPDPCPFPYDSVSTLAEGATADNEGNVYGGDFLGDIKKFVKK